MAEHEEVLKTAANVVVTSSFCVGRFSSLRSRELLGKRDSDYCNFTTVLEEEAPITGNNDSPALSNLIYIRRKNDYGNKIMTTLLLNRRIRDHSSSMDPEAFLDLANQVVKLKMFPYFDIAHCVLCALHVREDLGAGAHAFSRKHPMSCWLSTMLVVFAGGMLCNGLLGEPILAPLKNTGQLVVATVVWYVVFYTPFDIGYKAAKFLPIKLVCAAMKEVYRISHSCPVSMSMSHIFYYRCKKVYDGVSHAAKLYPNAYIIMILIGTLKGNGAGFTKLFERLIRGVWTPTAMEFMQPSFPTKACIVASIIFVLDKKTDIISAPHALVYFGIVIFFVYFKLSSVLLGIHDPFVPFENLFCALFLGGIWDSLAKLLGRGGNKDEKVDAKKKD
uniref:Trimeric intracellular cation channel type B n=1 Tax=Timema cristinae TaxID=61476 RepID=A0A7R9GS45_TIMCR|nr:unnamed protein product [Timema cristinae]